MTNKHFYRAIIIRLFCVVAVTITGTYLFFVKGQVFGAP